MILILQVLQVKHIICIPKRVINFHWVVTSLEIISTHWSASYPHGTNAGKVCKQELKLILIMKKKNDHISNNDWFWCCYKTKHKKNRIKKGLIISGSGSVTLVY